MSTWPESLTPSSILADPRTGVEYQFDGWSDGHANLINKEGKVERWTYYDVKKSLHHKTPTISTRTIHCEIHGQIELPLPLFSLVDTPLFQRLRNLKQCGLVYHVFPGTSHNRFEHSIGVAHLAGLMVTHLQKHQPELQITDREVLCVQVAGLLHDIGHGPYSHTFEKVARGFKHEHQTLLLLQQFEPKVDLTRAEWQMVAQLITGISPDPGREFLYQIVCNKESGLDVDKMDYILRDSKNTSIRFGCDIMRLIQGSRAVVVNGRRVVAFAEKLARDLVALFRTRFHLHEIVYQHKVVMGIELMVLDALEIGDQKGAFGGFKLLRDILWKDPEQFLLLDDSIINQVMRSDCEEARQLVQRIHERRLYKCVLQTDYGRWDEVMGLLEGLEQKVHCCPVVMNWGLGSRNPVAMVYFFDKMGVARRMAHLGYDLPQRFETELLRVYVKEPSDVEVVKGRLEGVEEC